MVADTELMQRALARGDTARRRTAPNPWVGAVVVRDGEVVGEGATQPPGGAHAEIEALRVAGDRARAADDRAGTGRGAGRTRRGLSTAMPAPRASESHGLAFRAAGDRRCPGTAFPAIRSPRRETDGPPGVAPPRRPRTAR